MSRARATAGGAAALVVGLAVALALLVHDARSAQHRLDRAQMDASVVLAATRRGDNAAAEAWARRLHSETAGARHATSGWLWAAAERVPILGRTPRAIRTVASVASTLSDQVLTPMMSLQSAIAADPPLSEGRIDLPRVESFATVIDAASRQLHAARTRLDEVDRAAVLGAVRRRMAAVAARVDGLDQRFSALARAIDVAPRLLGADGPRRYLVVLQNNAEARGTGGLAGDYLVLQADAGRLRVTGSGSDDEFDAARAPVSELGPAYQALYGSDPALWTNANLSPQFPDAARLWLASWQQVRRTAPDGVVAIDPVTLGRLLAVTGPVQLPAFGEIDADNAVTVTERDAYVWFARDNAARQRFLLTSLARIVDRVLHDAGPHRAGLMWALAGAAEEGRLLAYSTRPHEQAALGGMGWTGELPTGREPFVRLTVDNASATKLDLYLRRTLVYRLGPCTGGVRESSVTAVLTSLVPAQRLPSYVAVRHDVPASSTGDYPPGSNRLLLYLHLTHGAGLDNAALDGRRIAVHTGSEAGHPVVALALDLDRGQTRTLVLRLVEPATSGSPTVSVQPLAQPQHTSIIAQPCGPNG